MWQWPYEPEIDKWGIARVRIPDTGIQSYLSKGYRVHLMCPDGSVVKGRVTEFNRHYARVRVEKDVDVQAGP
jgi:hypothetical protein